MMSYADTASNVYFLSLLNHIYLLVVPCYGHDNFEIEMTVVHLLHLNRIRPEIILHLLQDEDGNEVNEEVRRAHRHGRARSSTCTDINPFSH